MNVSDRYQRLLKRRAPDDDRVLKRFSESYEIQPGENTKYILGALKPIDAKYTARLEEQGERVINQLSKRLGLDYPLLEFRRQGSVSNKTHIRYYSDVDVLAIIDKYVTLEHPQKPPYPYNGNPIDDLIKLRADCVRELKEAFPKVEIDNNGTTCVSLSGGSLACKVDVVPSNWYDTNDYAASKLEHKRGIQVFNREEKARKLNRPFLFNHLLDINDNSRMGLTRMLIRLLKTVKADSEEDGKNIDFSSFDICSIVYRMPDNLFRGQFNTPLSVEKPLDVIRNLLIWLGTTLSEESIKTSIKVVDDSRLIYDRSEKAKGALILFNELNDLYKGAEKEQQGKVLFTKSHLPEQASSVAAW
jgi:hypothetical protein